MDNCPFCGHQVDENLIVYGGICPKCFGEIPGEEAATDPGEQVKAEQARSDRRRSTFKVIAPLFALAPVVSCVGVLAVVFLLWPDPPMRPIIDFDQDPFGLSLDDMVGVPQPGRPPEVVAAAPTVKPGTAPKPSGQPKTPAPVRDPLANMPKPGRVPDLNAGGLDGIAAADPTKEAGAGDLDGPKRVVPESAPTRPAGLASTPDVSSGGVADGGGLDLFGSVGRKKAALTDPEAVTRMIGLMMNHQASQLKACFESRLKQDENLTGRWRVQFTVTQAGSVKDAVAEGVNVTDAEFESCMVQKMLRWRFDPIGWDQQVQKSWRFAPGV